MVRRMKLKSLVFVMVLCGAALAQTAPIKHEWVFVGWQPIQWESPPSEAHLRIKTSPAEILVFYPNGEFTDVRCLLIKRQDGEVVISNGDGQVVAAGHWTRQGETITVESQVVYRTVHRTGQTLPEPPTRRVFTSRALRGKWEVKGDGKTYKPMPEIADMDNLSVWAATRETPAIPK
jgi:hypothetical protein